jgi:hypothetical protein
LISALLVVSPWWLPVTAPTREFFILDDEC